MSLESSGDLGGSQILGNRIKAFPKAAREGAEDIVSTDVLVS